MPSNTIKENVDTSANFLYLNCNEAVSNFEFQTLKTFLKYQCFTNLSERFKIKRDKLLLH